MSRIKQEFPELFKDVGNDEINIVILDYNSVQLREIQMKMESIWLEQIKHNEAQEKARNDAIQKVRNVLAEIGVAIQEPKPFLRHNASAKNKKWFTQLLETIEAKFPRVIPEDSFYCNKVSEPKKAYQVKCQSYPSSYSASTHTVYVRTFAKQIEEIQQYVKGKQEQDKKCSEELAIYIKKAIELGLDITDLSTVCKRVEDVLSEKWRSENYVEGMEMGLDDNICECQTWIAGEHRCSCGGRRISCNVEGNMIHGYYFNLEAH